MYTPLKRHEFDNRLDHSHSKALQITIRDDRFPGGADHQRATRIAWDFPVLKRKMHWTNFLCTIGILLLVNQLCFCQYEYGKRQFGVYSIVGHSLGNRPVGPAVQNLTSPPQYGFVGVGFYQFFQLRNDSTYNTAGFFRFMRVDFGLASRSGIFELSTGPAVLTTADVDLAVLFPLSFKAAQEIDAYCSVGPVVTYQLNNVMTPVQPSPELSTTKLGYAIELGFRLKSGSYIGYRTMNQSGDFSFRVGGFCLGFSPQNVAKRKK